MQLPTVQAHVGAATVNRKLSAVAAFYGTPALPGTTTLAVSHRTEAAGLKQSFAWMDVKPRHGPGRTDAGTVWVASSGKLYRSTSQPASGGPSPRVELLALG